MKKILKKYRAVLCAAVTLGCCFMPCAAVSADADALERGSAGDEVVLVQQRLFDLGYVQFRATGNVDATHPYATEATRTICEACETTGVEYHRLLRTESELPKNSIVFETAAEAAEYLESTAGNVLLTTGAKELPAFKNLDIKRIFPRVLPTLDGIRACEALDIPHRNIIAMQGPFSLDLNRVILEQFNIQWLVTKDGGAVGGFMEKAKACAYCGARLIVLRRPRENGETVESILERCRELL